MCNWLGGANYKLYCTCRVWHSGREGVDPITTFLSLLSHVCLHCLEELLTPPHPTPPSPPFPPSHPFPPTSFLTCTIYSTVYDCVHGQGTNVRPPKGGMVKHLCLQHFLNSIIPYVWHRYRMIIKSLFWEIKIVNKVLYRRLNFVHNVRIFRLRPAWKSWRELARATTVSTSQNVCIHIKLPDVRTMICSRLPSKATLCYDKNTKHTPWHEERILQIEGNLECRFWVSLWGSLIFPPLYAD